MLEIVPPPSEELTFDAHMSKTAENYQKAKGETDDTPATQDGKDITTPEPEKPAVEEKPAPAAEVAAKPAAEVKDRVVDPETGEEVDGRTREGKRIIRLIARTHEAEANAARLQAALIAASKPAAPAKEAAPVVEAPKEPKIEDYTDVNAFIADAVKFQTAQAVEKALAADRAAQQSEQNQRERTARDAAIDVREAAFVKEHPDYHDVVDTKVLPILEYGISKGNPTAIAIRDVLQNHEQGPHLAYLLADEAVHARLAALPPGMAVFELGKLASENAPTKKEKEIPKSEVRSKAPAPPETVEGRASAAEPDSMNLDFDTHAARENAREARARSERRQARTA